MTPYYEADGVVIYRGDCRDVIPTLTTPVDHVITDPPYSFDTTDGARTSSSRTLNDARQLIEFAATDALAIAEVLALVAARRWAILSVDWQHVLPLKLNPPEGYRFVRHGVWIKPNATPQFTGDRPAQGWEAIAILHAARPGRMRWRGGGLPAVWTHNKVAGFHPTGKPEALLLDWVEQFTDPGDVILDPYMGGGTTLVAAKRLGRRAIGIELDPKYCDVTIARLNQNALPLGWGIEHECSTLPFALADGLGADARE